jgi:hypothetical protein
MKLIFSTLFNLVFIFIVIVGIGCDNERIDSQIPFTSFPDIIINLKSQQYLALQNPLGHVLIDGGLKGIIIYRSGIGDPYLAYERNCSYQPLDNRAIVEVALSGLSMQDLSCSSTFGFAQGFPSGGPAQSPLRMYRTILNGDILTITDEPLN